MAPKSKSQKKNDQRRRNRGNAASGSGRDRAEVNQKDQRAISALAKQNKEQSNKLFELNSTVNALKTALFKQPGSPTGPDYKSDVKLDEKYVKVPTDAEIALQKLEEAIKPAMKSAVYPTSGIAIADQKNLTEALTAAKTAVVKQQESVPKSLSLHCIPQRVHSKFVQIFQVMKCPIDLPQSGDLTAIKTLIRAGLGERPIRMKLLMELLITTTVTTGVTNTVSMGGNSNGLYVSNTSEWASISALFDEVKCMGGSTTFLYKNPVTGTGISAVVKEDMPVIAYDPADASGTASGTFNIMELQQHAVLNPIFATFTNTYNVPSNGIQHKFSWHVPKGTMISTSVTGDDWIPTANATSTCFGQLRFYHIGVVVTAINTGAGVITLDCEFRCRS